jgi:hypothetical protein
MAKAKIKEVNPENPLTPLGEAEKDEIAVLAKRQKAAGGLLIKAVNLVGSSVEDSLKMLPKIVRQQLDRAAQAALLKSYDAAARTRGGDGRLAAWGGVCDGGPGAQGSGGVLGGCGRRGADSLRRWRSCRSRPRSSSGRCRAWPRAMARTPRPRRRGWSACASSDRAGRR